jgi:hypothetical protein
LGKRHRAQQPSWPGAVPALAGEIDETGELAGTGAAAGGTFGVTLA